jgi:hypothetical protein
MLAAALASVAVPYDDMDDLESVVSPPLSVISGKGREELISRAATIRQEAVDADEICFQLEAKRRRAVYEGKVREAFLLRQQIGDAEVVAKRLHERAERRYYRGTWPRNLCHLVFLCRMFPILHSTQLEDENPRD